MKIRAFVTSVCIGAIGSTLALAVSAADNNSAPEAMLAEQWSMIENYCTDCHNYDEFRGGISLEGLGPDDVHANPDVWEEVLRKLKISAMPPRKQDQPAKQQRQRFVAALEKTLDAAANADPYAGLTTIHRLNRAEYSNVIRDLFGLDLDLTELLPSDGGDFGFDNIADLLRTSPMLLDRYMTVGLRVADMALGNPDASLNTATLKIPFDTSQDKHLRGLPIGTRGGIATTHYFPADAEYIFAARPLNGVAEGYFGIEGHDRPHEFLVYVDGEVVYSSKIGGPEDTRSVLKMAMLVSFPSSTKNSLRQKSPLLQAPMK